MTKVSASSNDILTSAAAAIVVLAFNGQETEGTGERECVAGPAAALDKLINGQLTKLVASQEMTCKLGKVSVFYNLPGVAAPCVAVVGGGDRRKFGAGEAFRAAGAAAKRLADIARDKICFDFGEQPDAVHAAAVAGSLNGGVGQDLFRLEKSLKPASELIWHNATPAAIARGKAIGEGMLLTRELVNLPANYMYPEEFARRAAHVAVSSGLELEIWDELRLRKERCNSLLGVSAGSSRPPRLLILRYRGTKQQPPLALVGKGVTFDSGGLSIKPSDGMLTMKCDMAGAATVLGAMQAIAQLKLEAPVVGLVGLVENMISGSSFKLGDVLTARSGKTIEIHNTDAEGRLVLADVLNVAVQEKPAHIVDLATLTGACCVALGLDIAGAMSNSEEWQAKVLAAAKAAGEEVWPLPMHDFFAEQISSKVADIKNMGEGRWRGAITAAKFLQEFVEDTPWVHLDIAGPAFAEGSKPHMDGGGTGAMVRTLVQLVEKL